MLTRIKIVSSLAIAFLGLHTYLFAEIITSGWKDSCAYRPNPVLFLHGFGEGDPQQTWTEAKVDEILSQYYSKYYTSYSSDPTVLSSTRYPYLELIDFGSSLVDRNSSIDTYKAGDRYVQSGQRNPGDPGWSDKLNTAVGTLREYYINRDGSPQKITLVAHSMGGLAARKYLKSYSSANQEIEKLIMIGTPNLGSYLATKTVHYSRNRRLGWYIFPHIWISSSFITTTDEILESALSVDIDGDAVWDMDSTSTGSGFIGELNYSYLATVDHFAIAGRHWSDFNLGDSVASLNSQLGVGVLLLKNQSIINSAHWAEPALSVVGDNPLLKFLDSTLPELEIISPNPNQTTEIQETSIHIQGVVYKEYLPADSELTITVTRQEDGYILPPQTSFLKPSDLWIPNNPDSPVAEFDEIVNLPGKGTYKIYCQVKNPAGLTSDVKEVWVKIREIYPVLKIYPIEEVSLAGGSCRTSTVHEAMQEARSPRFDNPKFWTDFVIGQGVRKYWDLYEDRIYYGAGIHRSYLSFDTSVLGGKKVILTKLVMFCNDKDFENGGMPFFVRVYSGSWEKINADFDSWNLGTTLVTEKHSDLVIPATFDEYSIPLSLLNIQGKTQFRICSSREEDQIDPVEPPLSEGTCTVVNHSKHLFELINWDRERIWLEIEIEP